jgi:K+-transporting ATPase A subunit
MTGNMLLQYGVFLLVVTFLVQPPGGYMARVFQREKTFLDWDTETGRTLAVQDSPESIRLDQSFITCE